MTVLPRAPRPARRQWAEKRTAPLAGSHAPALPGDSVHPLLPGAIPTNPSPVRPAALEGGSGLLRFTASLTLQQRLGLEEEFEKHAARWREETEHLSSTDVFTHPAYQQIIGLGRDAVPLILRDLASTGSHWFWALRAITGANPVRAEDTGYLPRMTKAWLEWGRREGLYE